MRSKFDDAESLSDKSVDSNGMPSSPELSDVELAPQLPIYYPAMSVRYNCSCMIT